MYSLCFIAMAPRGAQRVMIGRVRGDGTGSPGPESAPQGHDWPSAGVLFGAVTQLKAPS
jgi:hypothetical protein